MLRYGGAVIRMRQNFDDDITYLVGGQEIIRRSKDIPARMPFDEDILDFFNDVSRKLMADRRVKEFPDVVTFAFWIRRASALRLKERFHRENGNLRMGRGIIFHIAPSNVPVNYAYSLAAGLLTGNVNLVRLPSKDFPQTDLINSAIEDLLEKYPQLKPYICLMRYGRQEEINDLLSGIADVRIIWGGDATIEEIRKSPLPPRSGEITFADRFSLAVIDSDSYMALEDKGRAAEGFYNDTYLTDQNACTSPRMVIWMGGRIQEAKEIFWEELHKQVRQRYVFQPIQGINKLTSGYFLAAAHDGIKIEKSEDNLIIRVRVPKITGDLMEFKDNCGYFLEYDCKDVLEFFPLCNDDRCQTIAYIGDKMMLLPLLGRGAKGIDRIVPVGKTMDFDLIWDGNNLYERLTRIVSLND